MPIAEWLNFLETDASIQKHLPVILANFYSFATHPERPYGRQYVNHYIYNIS